MKVFDVFLFGFELDLLELRMNLLDPYVDYFVFSESKDAFSGESKGLVFESNKDKFEKFKDKIIYTVIDDPLQEDFDRVSQLYNIAGYPTFQRDAYQKDSIKKVLEKYCTDDDIILWSDLDEVPNPEVLENIESFYDPTCVYNFAQDNYQGYLNWFETTGTITSQTLDFEYTDKPRWIGTKMCSYSILKKYTMTQMRRELPAEKNVRIHPGGWHWSTVGSIGNTTYEERVLRKIDTSAHTELKNSNLLQTLRERIEQDRSPLGQDNAAYMTVPFDEERFPEYLIQNREKYEHLIKK